jgi:DNA-binding CsgD family transcriptional regulator
MSSAAIVVLCLVAFLSAPPSFVLLWILYLRTRDRAARDLTLALLGNAFILLGNLLTALAEGSAHPLPNGVYVLLLDEVTVATVMAGAFVCRFAHDATRVPVTSALRIGFWCWAFVLHAVALSAAVFTEGAGVTGGFVLATLAALAMQAYATVLILAKRARIPGGFFIPHLPRYFVPLIVLGFLASASDIFEFGQRLGGNGIPFSPFFGILINAFIIVTIGRRLVAASPAQHGGDAATGHSGLTLRESEILPLLLEGASNEEIGQRLHISSHTVKNHVTVIFRKTGAENRFDLLKTFKPAEQGAAYQPGSSFLRARGPWKPRNQS